MSEFYFGVFSNPPSRKQAKQMNKICQEEAGRNAGFDELNVVKGKTPSVNNGAYQGYFFADNRGDFLNDDLRRRVMDRVEKEVGKW